MSCSFVFCICLISSFLRCASLSYLFLWFFPLLFYCLCVVSLFLFFSCFYGFMGFLCFFSFLLIWMPFMNGDTDNVDVTGWWHKHAIQNCLTKWTYVLSLSLSLSHTILSFFQYLSHRLTSKDTNSLPLSIFNKKIINLGTISESQVVL